jgi:type II secretory pathway pseudopilin PulG
MRFSSMRGFALVDLIFSCALMAIIAAIAIPARHATRDRDAARLAAKYLATRMQVVRLEALKRNTTVALRFDPVDLGRIGTYVDGDGDGVLQRDIEVGTDPSLLPDTRLEEVFESVAFRIANDLPDPEGGATLGAGSDPIRLGASNFLSFSPLGGATSGTLYLAGRAGAQVCVRVLGATGRLRVLWFDTASGTWRQD